MTTNGASSVEDGSVPGGPVIDADAHFIESVSLLMSYLDKIGGTGASARVVESALNANPLATMGDTSKGEQRAVWWGTATDTRDLASVMAPGLLSERLADIGVDFLIGYPTLGAVVPTLQEAELRQIACRAVNVMNAELCEGLGHRLIPGAVVPTHTPDEAIAELRYCVERLGYKTAAIMPGVARPLSAYPTAFPGACRMDRYGIDSDYDYDPLWATFQELGVAVCAHGSVGLRYLDCGRHSPSNHVFNHIGGHQYMQGELAKSLVLGGVPQRFPRLNFAFLEAGAGWAVELFHALEEHWRKRGSSGIERFDPALIDRTELSRLLSARGLEADPLDPSGHPSDVISGTGPDSQTPEWVRDEFESSGLGDLIDITAIFRDRFFLGSEAEDRSVAYAFWVGAHRYDVSFNPMYGSDIGHWDGTRVDDIVNDTKELAELELITLEDYRRLVFENAVRLHGRMNPHFFDGTGVADEAQALLSGSVGLSTGV